MDQHQPPDRSSNEPHPGNSGEYMPYPGYQPPAGAPKVNAADAPLSGYLREHGSHQQPHGHTSAEQSAHSGFAPGGGMTTGDPSQPPRTQVMLDYPEMAPPDKKGLAIAGMILGISTILLSCAPVCGIVLAIPGMILSIMGVKSSGKGMAIAGIVTCSCGIISSIIFWIINVLILVGEASMQAGYSDYGGYGY